MYKLPDKIPIGTRVYYFYSMSRNEFDQDKKGYGIIIEYYNEYLSKVKDINNNEIYYVSDGVIYEDKKYYRNKKIKNLLDV